MSFNKNTLLAQIRLVEQSLKETLKAIGFSAFEPVLGNHHKSTICNVVFADVRNYGLNEIASIKKRQIALSPNEQNPTPIIAIVDIDNINLKTLFELGAADYISYPFITQELKIRLLPYIIPKENNVAKNQQTSIQNILFRSVKSGKKIFEDNRQNLLVDRAVNYLSSTLTENISLDQLARNLGTNRNKLSKAFKDYFGLTIFNWLREQRLIQASSLLQTTSLSIQQISEQVGYLDSNNFSTAFKREFKLSPCQYRKANSKMNINTTANAANKDLRAAIKG